MTHIDVSSHISDIGGIAMDHSSSLHPNWMGDHHSSGVHTSSTDGLACDWKGSLQACNNNIMPKMIGGAAGGAAVGSAGGLAGAGVGALTGGISGGTAGCVGGVITHLGGCW